MSVANEITRIQGAKSSIKSAIEAKGVTVPSNALIDSFATYIAQISGGSSGLEYESGTYTPSEAVSRPTISFSKTHSTTPFLVLMFDSTNTYDDTLYSNYEFYFIDYYRLFGTISKPSSTSSNYAYCYRKYRNNTATSLSGTSSSMSHNSDESGASSTSYPRYFVNESEFFPYSTNTVYWRTGRTYKWIAVWKP